MTKTKNTDNSCRVSIYYTRLSAQPSNQHAYLSIVNEDGCCLCCCIHRSICINRCPANRFGWMLGRTCQNSLRQVQYALLNRGVQEKIPMGVIKALSEKQRFMEENWRYLGRVLWPISENGDLQGREEKMINFLKKVKQAMGVIEDLLSNDIRLGFGGVETKKFFVLELSFVPDDFFAFNKKNDPLLFMAAQYCIHGRDKIKPEYVRLWPKSNGKFKDHCRSFEHETMRIFLFRQMTDKINFVGDLNTPDKRLFWRLLRHCMPGGTDYDLGNDRPMYSTASMLYTTTQEERPQQHHRDYTFSDLLALVVAVTVLIKKKASCSPQRRTHWNKWRRRNHGRWRTHGMHVMKMSCFQFTRKEFVCTPCRIPKGRQKEPYRIRVIYWIYGIRSPQVYRTRVLYWTYGIRFAWL